MVNLIANPDVEMIEITPIRAPEDLKDAMAIRRRVFVEEQKCPPGDEWDGLDDASRHFLGRVDGRPVATARWRATPHNEKIVAKLERFAVDKGYRGRGYGRALVQAVMDDARSAGFDVMMLNAQAHLTEFYASFGFRDTGRHFNEAGLPHVEMVLTIRHPRGPLPPPERLTPFGQPRY